MKAFTWSPDSRFLAITSNETIERQQRPRNDRISLWNVENLDRVDTLEGDREITRLLWATETELISISSGGRILWKHDGSHWAPQSCPTPLTELTDLHAVLSLSEVSYDGRWFSHDGRWLAKPRKNDAIEVIDTAYNTVMGSIELPTFSKMAVVVRDAQWSPMGNRIAVLIGLKKEETKTKKHERQELIPTYSSWNIRSRRITWATKKTTDVFEDRIIILNPIKGTKVRTINVSGFKDGSLYVRISSLSWHPNGLILAGSKADGIVFWDLKRGNAIGGMEAKPYSLLWSPDGRLLAGHDGNTIRIWDVSSISMPEQYLIPPSKALGYEGSEKQIEDLIERQPEVLGYGYQFIGRQVQAADGRIDLLMEGPDGAKVVVELKRGEADDITVGQILRYLSWVELSYPSTKPPRGIIVAKKFSDNLRLAVRGSSYHIQLIPASMIVENYRREED